MHCILDETHIPFQPFITEQALRFKQCIGARASEVVNQKFSLERMVSQIEQIYLN